MPYYKDMAGGVHFIDSADYESLLPAGCTPITDTEATELLAPEPEPLDALRDRAGVVRRNPRNFRQPSSSPATSASRSMNLPSVWKV